MGSLRPARSVFDVSPDNDRDAALIRAAKLARANGKLVAWDNSERDYAIALYDEQTHQVQPLTDEEAAILLNREVLIRRAWRKWNAASKNRERMHQAKRLAGRALSDRFKPTAPDDPSLCTGVDPRLCSSR